MKKSRADRLSKKELRQQAVAACADRSGRITPERVWQAARDPQHVLHNEFEWNVKKAAEQQWCETASRLIREFKFTVIIEKKKYLAPYYVSDHRVDYPAYVETARIARREDWAERQLQEELTRIEGAVKRARGLAAAFELQAHFERLLDNIIEIRRHLDDDEHFVATAEAPTAPA